MRAASIRQPLSRIGTLRLLLVLIGILAGSYVSHGASVAEIYRSALPSRAADARPKNGFAFNAVADAKLDETIREAAAKTERASSNLARWQEIASNALQSFRLEPLNASALRNLALAAEANGDMARAKVLIAHAVKFSRRDTAANNWQLRQALMAQDLPSSMRLLDRILREDDSLHLRYLPVLIAGVSQPEGLNAIYSILVKQPAWERKFWSMAGTQADIPPELAILRQKLFLHDGQKIPMIPFSTIDIYLIRNLLRNNHFEAAKLLHDFLSGAQTRSAASDISNVRTMDFIAYGSPFDWQTISQGEVQAYLNDTGDGLTVETASNSIGVFARHLVESVKGRFRINISAQAVRGIELFARLKCTEQGTPAAVIKLTFDADYKSEEKVINTDCRWFVLELLARNKLPNPSILNIESVNVQSSRLRTY